MNVHQIVMEHIKETGSIEERIFIRRLETCVNTAEVWRVLNHTMKALQDEGLSYVEIKGAFEIMRKLYGV